MIILRNNKLWKCDSEAHKLTTLAPVCLCFVCFVRHDRVHKTTRLWLQHYFSLLKYQSKNAEISGLKGDSWFYVLKTNLKKCKDLLGSPEISGFTSSSGLQIQNR